MPDPEIEIDDLGGSTLPQRYQDDMLTTSVLDKMDTRLRDTGRCSKAEGCAGGYERLIEQVPWQAVETELEHRLGEELVPMKDLFFQDFVYVRDAKGRLKKKVEDGKYVTTLMDARRDPYFYIVGKGRGVRTAGYVLASYEGGIFAREKVKLNDKREEGVNGRNSRYAKTLADKNLPLPPVVDHRHSGTGKLLHGQQPAPPIPPSPQKP